MGSAIPKSATSVLPSRVSRMFSGFTSRWTTPCSWAYWSPRATSRVMRTASSGRSAPSRPSRPRSDSPSTYGMVYHRIGAPGREAVSISPESYTDTM